MTAKFQFVFPTIAVLAVIVGVIEYLNFSGFCYSSGRYLSDSDLIRAAIEYVRKQQQLSAETDVIRYESVEAFIGRNADCCVVHREDRGEFENVLGGRWVRLVGLYVVVVDVWYKFKESGPNNFYESSVAMTACGNVAEQHLSLNSRPKKSTGKSE